MAKKKTNKTYCGITLDPDLIEYLDGVAQQTSCSRSWVINAIVRQHAERAKQEQEEPKLFESSPMLTSK